MDDEDREMYVEGVDEITVLGKDQTRGMYEVKGVGTKQGGKVVKGRKYIERVLRKNAVEGVSGDEETMRKEVSEKRSEWVVSQARKWTQTMELLAEGQTKAKGHCQMCSEQAYIQQGKVELCMKCNRKLFSLEHARRVEGFMLLTAPPDLLEPTY